MGEAKRRELAGNTKPKGAKYKQVKPSKHRRYLVESSGTNRAKRRSEAE